LIPLILLAIFVLSAKPIYTRIHKFLKESKDKYLEYMKDASLGVGL
jgi:hypothetical protein